MSTKKVKQIAEDYGHMLPPCIIGIGVGWGQDSKALLQ